MHLINGPKKRATGKASCGRPLECLKKDEYTRRLKDINCGSCLNSRDYKEKVAKAPNPKKYYCDTKNCNNEIPKPKMCCSGVECGCMGMPIEPPICEICWKVVELEVDKISLEKEVEHYQKLEGKTITVTDEQQKWIDYGRKQVENEIRDGVYKLPAQWISVEERQPEEDQNVALFFSSCRVESGFIRNEVWYIEMITTSVATGETPKYWMPLPEAPEVEKNESPT